jgi:hypothetical protein
MDMQTYIRSLDREEREAFAGRADTTVGYLYQIAGKHRRPSPEMTLRLARASRGSLRPEDLRPDIYPAPSPSFEPQDGDPQSAEEVSEATG